MSPFSICLQNPDIQEKPDPEIRFNRFNYFMVFTVIPSKIPHSCYKYVNGKPCMSPFGICLQNPDIREKPGYPVQPFEFGVCMSSPEEGLAQGDRFLMEPERFIKLFLKI